jgi:hypothetical protein
MAFIGTLFINAVVRERLVEGAVYLAVILQIKPHWAFAVVVPLFLGRYRFFLRLLFLGIASYFTIVLLTMVIGGFSYVWTQYGEYVHFLSRLSRDFPWRGPEAPFLGYNHSIKQITVYLLGTHPWVFQLATVIKLLCLLPLGFVGLRFLRHPPGKPGTAIPRLALDWAFVLYLGAFIWLDMVWEVSLGIAIFPYLLATLARSKAKVLVWALFLPYALVDLIQVLSFTILGLDVVAPGPYVLTDPSIYVPMIMVMILAFYALFTHRLWRASRRLPFPEVA